MDSPCGRNGSSWKFLTGKLIGIYTSLHPSHNIPLTVTSPIRYTMDPITNEDGWYTLHSREMLGDGVSRPLAPFYDTVQFSVETVMHTKPFGVHQVWHFLTPDNEMVVSTGRSQSAGCPRDSNEEIQHAATYHKPHFPKALMSNCPELLRVMPGFFLEHWPNAVCGAAIDRTRFADIEFDWSSCAIEAPQDVVGQHAT